jgi:hypothetical protein
MTPAARCAVAIAQLTEALARILRAAADKDAESIEKLTLAVDRLGYDAEHETALIQRDIDNGA